MAKAKALVAASGTKGQKVTLILTPDSQTKSIGAYYVSLLNQLGYKAGIKILASAVQYPFVAELQEQGADQLLVLAARLRGAVELPGRRVRLRRLPPELEREPEPARVLRPGDGQARQGGAARSSSPNVKAANVMWAAIDKRVTDAAPIVALFVQNRLDFVSKRVGNYQASPSVVGDFMIDQAWVK